MEINGAQSSVSDLDNLKETLKNLEFDMSRDSKKKESGSIPKEPQYNDIVKGLGNLDMVIPMGFIMLHNDLQKLIDSQSGSVNNGSSSNGGIASAITAGATTVSAISDVVSLIKSPAGLEDILNNGEINEALAKDPSVYKIRLQGTLGYLESYYMNLIKNNGYLFDFNTGTLEDNGNFDVGEFFKDFTDAIGSGIGKAMEAIGEAMGNIEAHQELNSDESVKSTRKLGYIAYLKTYYANLVKPQGYKVTLDGLNKGTFTLAEGVSAQSIANTFSSTIASLLTGAIDTFGNSVETLMSSSSLDSDIGIKNIRSKGMSAYLKVYYGNLLNQFGYKISLDNLNKGDFTLEKDDTLGGFFKGLLNDATSVVGQSFSNLFSASANSILGVMDADSLKEDTDIKAIQKDGYYSYLKVHFDNLVNNFNTRNANFSKDDYKVINSAISSRIQEALKDDTLFNSSTNVEVNQMVEKTSSYNESNLFNKIDEVLNKLTFILKALSYEESEFSRSRLSTIDETLKSKLDEVVFTLETMPSNIIPPIKEGNENVDTGAQY